jgi:hypothetical protein
MRTASRVLGFALGAVALSTVLLGGTAQAAPRIAPATASTVCPGNLNWDGVGPCPSAN